MEPSFTASSGSDNLQADLSSFALKLEGKLPLKVIVIPVVLAWTHTHLYVHASHFHSTTNHHLTDYHFPTHIHIHYTQNAPPNVRFILTTSITTHSCIYSFYHPITPTFSHHFPHLSYPFLLSLLSLYSTIPIIHPSISLTKSSYPLLFITFYFIHTYPANSLLISHLSTILHVFLSSFDHHLRFNLFIPLSCPRLLLSSYHPTNFSHYPSH